MAIPLPPTIPLHEQMHKQNNFIARVAREFIRFDYNEINASNTECITIVTAKGKTLVVNERLEVICSDMPAAWMEVTLHHLQSEVKDATED
jgi:hypothetical protein